MLPEVKKTGFSRHKKAILAWAALSAIPTASTAATKAYVNSSPTSNWNSASNWSPSNEPTTNDDAFLTQNGDTDRLITYISSLASPQLASLHIDATGFGLMTLSQNQQTLRASTQYIGDSGIGRYFHSAGTNSAGTLYLGYDASANGTYALSNTANLQISSALYVGYGGAGTINQTGGNVAISNGAEFVLGYFGGSSGTYNLSGGTLSSPNMRIADDAAATGQFFQTGGNATITTDLTIASFSPSSLGSYALSAGTLSIGRNLIVADIGTADFSHTGGTLNINSSGTNGLVVGLAATAIGSFTLSNSAILNVTGRATIALNGSGLFTHSGGTHNINGDLIIAANTGTNSLNANYDLQSGALNATQITLNEGGAFIKSSGTLTFTTFTMNGGAITGNITNTGAFIYNQGAFNGRLTNPAGKTLTLNADFTASDGLSNASTITFSSNRTVTFNGQGLLNTGTIQLNNGVITGNGPLINNGTLAGTGLISGTGGITNNANLNITSGDFRISNTGAFLNNGAITISPSTSGVSLVLDAPNLRLDNAAALTLDNTAAISGSGALLNKPTGIINASNASIGPAFTNQGTLNVAIAGLGDLDITQPFTNSGTINITGPASILSGGLITNTGIINARSQISSAINNSGTIAASIAGVFEVTGELHNQPAGRITIAPAVIATLNLTTNAGTINVSAAGSLSTFTFNNTGALNISGTFDTLGVTNTGAITYTSAVLPVDSFGAITNNPAGAITLAANTAVIFYDNITHNPGASLTINTGASASFLGNLTGGGPVTNQGTLNLAPAKGSVLGHITGAGALNVPDNANLFADRITQSALTIGSSGLIAASVVINPAATPGGSTSKINSLTIAGLLTPAAKLDLNNTNLVIDYIGPTNINSIRDLIESGYNPGNPIWSGNGITSSTAAATPGRALGYGEASTLLGLSGTSTANWLGQTVDATSILIRHTLQADANLSGGVDFLDLVALAQNYPSFSGNNLWSAGDFNYDGNIDFNDLVILAQNYNTALPAAAPGQFSASFTADLSQALTSIPEPTTLITLLQLPAILLLKRNRRK